MKEHDEFEEYDEFEGGEGMYEDVTELSEEDEVEELSEKEKIQTMGGATYYSVTNKGSKTVRCTGYWADCTSCVTTALGGTIDSWQCTSGNNIWGQIDGPPTLKVRRYNSKSGTVVLNVWGHKSNQPHKGVKMTLTIKFLPM